MNCIVKVGSGKVKCGGSWLLLKAHKQKLGLKKLKSTELATVQTKLAVVRFYQIILLKVRFFFRFKQLSLSTILYCSIFSYFFLILKITNVWFSASITKLQIIFEMSVACMRKQSTTEEEKCTWVFFFVPVTSTFI